MSDTTAARAWQWVLWFGALVAVTLLLLSVRDRLDKAHIALVLLLVVLGGSAAGGRAIGIGLAVAAFLVFDLAFLRPYNTIVVEDPADWIALVAFLVTGVVAAELLERQRREAETARRRTEEIDRLAAVGAEALNAPHPEDALRAIADVIRLSTQTDRCEITAAGADDAPEAAGDALAVRLPSRDLRRVLRVRDRIVGTLHLSASRPFLLSAEQERVLNALSYYAALGLERVRLAGSEDEAAALRRADRVKDALLASVSHDLRTPLTAIKGIANEIARGEDPARAHLIEEEVDRLDSLVADLLDLSQLTAGEVRLDPAVNTADDVVGSALQRVEPAYPERTFQATLAEPWVELVGRLDFVQTVRILTNLLENAAKYAPARTPVHLRVWREATLLRFAVEDEGAGLGPSDRERAFEPFVRGAPRPAGTRGTGLGLAIARGLAEAQGGHLEYQPTAGVRSRFVLTLPAADIRTRPLDGSL